MKSILPLLVACAAFCSPLSGATLPSTLPIIEWSEATTDDLSAWTAEKNILQIREGDLFSFSFNLSGNLIELASGEANLLFRMRQTCFFGIKKGILMASHDLITWKPIHQFATGDINASCDVQPGIGPCIGLDVQIDRK